MNLVLFLPPSFIFTTDYIFLPLPGLVIFFFFPYVKLLHHHHHLLIQNFYSAFQFRCWFCLFTSPLSFEKRSCAYGCTGSSLLSTDFFLVAAGGGCSPLAVRGLLIAVAPLAVEHRLSGAWASIVMAHVTCGTVPEQGSDLCPLHWQVDS